MNRHRHGAARRGRILVAALLTGIAMLMSSTTATAGAREGTTASPASPATAVQTIESTFAVAGPWAVTAVTATVPGTPGVRLVYPTNLGASGYDHPIVAWGNGTGGNCSDEAWSGGSGPILRHLASWGFAVVCVESPDTGFGTQIWAAVQWLIDQNGNPSSAFLGRLDTANVGAIGHSQGATGATNATVLSGGVITSTVAIALVDPRRHNPPEQLPVFEEVESPIFFISGFTDDWATQPWQLNYWERVAPSPAAKAALRSTGHFDVVDRSRGYWTAWFRYTLADDPLARSAFVTSGGTQPEISTNPAWTNWQSRALP